MEKEAFIRDLLSQMTIEEKVAQLSCTTAVTIIRNSKVKTDLLKPYEHVGLGRITQFGTPFYQGPKSVAKAYNDIQRFLIEHTRLKIPALMQMEVIGGPLMKGGTSFPAPLAIASSFQPKLVKKMAEKAKDECKSVGVKLALGPDLDIVRDSRWGRVIETFGEDPYLTSQFGKAYVQGLQGNDYSEHVAACAKHFLGFSAAEASLHSGYVPLGNKELYETYGTPFAACIKDENMQAVMVTYSEVDGEPVSVNKSIVDGMLRHDFGFTGTVLCDGTSIEKAHNDQKIGESMAEVAKMALEAGIDCDTPITDAYHYIPELIEKGELDEALVDLAVERILSQKYDLGLFEHPFIDEDCVEPYFVPRESALLSKEIAQESLILLKNENVIPLRNKQKKIALIGPHGNSRRCFFYGYSYASHIEMLISIVNRQNTTMDGISSFYSKIMDKEELCQSLQLNKGQATDEAIEAYLAKSENCKTLLEALQEYDQNVCFCKGCDVLGAEKEQFQEAVDLAKESDVIIYAAGGINGWSEYATSGEGRSRGDLNLPGVQEALLDELSKTGKPIILVLMNGRPMSIVSAAKKCDAIIEVWVNGPCGADVIAETIFGKLNPSGKLPVTIPRTSTQIPIYYGHKNGSGYHNSFMCKPLTQKKVNASMGYIPYDFEPTAIGGFNDELHLPLYPFGYGLSYTEFEIHEFKMSERVEIGDEIWVECTIKNIGGFDGSEVIQVYYSDLYASVVRPNKQLVAFEKVYLKKGQSANVTFKIHTYQLGFLNRDLQFVVEAGKAKIQVGTNCDETLFEGVLDITGKTRDIKNCRKFSSSNKIIYQ